MLSSMELHNKSVSIKANVSAAILASSDLREGDVVVER